jgi:alkylhydroperoxidase/carboxymuconolactone decarboxylase family protein YurZ
MAGNSAWVRMERLLEIGFTHEKLLEEIMHALSTDEAENIFDHIERMHDIGEEEEEEEKTLDEV